MSRRKLTPQEKEVFVSMLEYSSRGDRWRIFWWGIVSRRKQWALLDRLHDGMNWRSAMKQVRETGPGVMYDTRYGIELTGPYLKSNSGE